MHEFGFNQAEARKAMDSALQQDPQCAMCQWGVAYVNGPFLNHPIMSSTQSEVTYHAIRKATELCAATAPARCTAEEAGMIHALLQRYPSPDATANQSVGFVAYVEALQGLVDSLGDEGYFAADVQAMLP